MPPYDVSIHGAAGGRAAAGKPKTGPRADIVKLQRVALKHATSQDTPVGVVASLMRAYVDLQEMRMNLDGQGKPKPVEAANSLTSRPARPTVRPKPKPPQP